ncbi:hypothetical protein A2U01_0045482, partial [Trifolium medium]|nr:hypothetical protein [Trifolium medium]
MVRMDDRLCPSPKVTGVVINPSGWVVVPSNAVKGPSWYGCSFSVWFMSFANRFRYMMLHELPWSTSILETLCLAIVAVMSSGRPSFGVTPTRSESENPKVGLLAFSGLRSVLWNFWVSCKMFLDVVPPEIVAMCVILG